MLTEKDYAEIRKELDESKNPLFLFHDDADGLTSFLLLYRSLGRGSGMMVKSVPKVDHRFVSRASQEEFDKIFVADVAMMEQSFVDTVKKPIIWIDHHQPVQLENVRYFNPRSSNISDNYPASYLCYKVSGKEEDLWIAMTGIVGDWFIPEFADEFAKKYPDLWGKNIKKPDDAMYETRLGELIKIFSFVLKGPTFDAIKCMKMMTRINDPYEILEQKTPTGKYLYGKYEQINKYYQEIYDAAKKEVKRGKFLIYTYKGEQSLSGEVSNELLHFNPKKVILIGRERDGEVRMSLRGSGKNVILPRLKKALEGVKGYGGGHEYACGAAVKIEDFPKFVEQLKAQFQ